MTTKHMLISQVGHDDYEVWLTDNLEDKDSGFSERGTKLEIKETVDEYMLTKDIQLTSNHE